MDGGVLAGPLQGALDGAVEWLVGGDVGAAHRSTVVLPLMGRADAAEILAVGLVRRFLGHCPGRKVDHTVSSTASGAASTYPEGVDAFIKVERTGPAIRAALREVSPDEVPDFEAEFHTALAEADDDFDVSRIDRVIGRWWRIAHLRLNPIPEEERAQAERAAAGHLEGTFTRDGGGWVPN